MLHGGAMNDTRRADVRLSCFDRAYPSHPTTIPSVGNAILLPNHHASTRGSIPDLHNIDENAHNDEWKRPRIAQAPRNGTVRKGNKGNETP